ncbi:MAG: hypothetical protein OXS28_03680, partial [Gammaproteobacteria bacterium]|nr:hypothetical protein [Gammaproteobacteria bacterium]
MQINGKAENQQKCGKTHKNGKINPGVRVKLTEPPDYPDIENYFSDSATSEISNNFTLTPSIFLQQQFPLTPGGCRNPGKNG